MLSFLLAILCGLQGTDWPQWRGSNGMAVSAETGLPSALGADSPELLWRVPVPGAGISSPIVSAGKVFVTTAYPGRLGSDTALLMGLAYACAGLTLALGVRRVLRRPEDAAPGWVRLIDRAVIGLGALGLSSAALLALAAPSLARISSGTPGDTWLVTGTILMLSGVVAAGMIPAVSSLRLLLAASWVGLGVSLFQNVPLNKYAEEYAAVIRLAMIVPALVGAAWHFVAFVTSGRGSPAPGQVLGGLLGALVALVTGGSVFALYNFLAPSQGLVRAALAYDLETGEELWHARLFVAPEEIKYDKNSYATPTPCATGDVLFASFGSGDAGLDYDGNVLWTHVDESYPETTRYGAAASPVLFEDTVILLRDKEIDRGPSTIRALDPRTGETRWHVEPWKNHDCYTTPLIVEREGAQELVTVTFGRVVAYDPRSGDELWEHPLPVEQVVPSLQYEGDLLIVAGGTHENVSTTGLELSGTGVDTTAEVLWQTRRSVPEIASPVLVDGCFYTVTDGGILTCFDPTSGDTHYRERLDPGYYRASIVAGDGKLYVFNDEGVVTTIKTGPDFEVLAQGTLTRGSYSTPAIAAGRILVRTKDELFCFGATR